MYECFSGFGQPARYIVNDLYPPEREEYEEMLGGKPREQIFSEDFGLVSWSPLPFLTLEAMGYMLPRLMELSVSEAKDRDGDLFLMRFINLISIGPDNAQFTLLESEHRIAIHAFLLFLDKNFHDLIESECWDEWLQEALQRWKNA